MTKFTLHLEEPDQPRKGREAFIRPTNLAIWAVGPLDSDGEWSWAIRYAQRDGVPLITELKTIPTEKLPEFIRRPWKWSRNTDAVPGNGLPLTAVHNLALGRIDNQIRQALANYDHPAWPGRRDTLDDDLPDHYVEWHGVTQMSGIDRTRTASPVRPGRPQLSAEHLAEVALHYTTALARGVPTTRYIEEQMQEGNERLPVNVWVSKAREREFLTPTPVKGRPGGHLTKHAEAVIAERELVSPRPQTNEGKKR
jgi:hypothetical protein